MRGTNDNNKKGKVDVRKGRLRDTADQSVLRKPKMCHALMY